MNTYSSAECIQIYLLGKTQPFLPTTTLVAYFHAHTWVYYARWKNVAAFLGLTRPFPFLSPLTFLLTFCKNKQLRSDFQRDLPLVYVTEHQAYPQRQYLWKLSSPNSYQGTNLEEVPEDHLHICCPW